MIGWKGERDQRIQVMPVVKEGAVAGAGPFPSIVQVAKRNWNRRLRR
jgi:hypothetical protein